MNQNRTRKILPLIAVLPLALAACGGGGNASPNESSAVPAASGSLDAICQAAAAEGGEAVWYESSLPEQTDEIIATFNQTHPDVGVVHQRVTGGAGIGGLVVQERQAGGRTADLVTASPDIVQELADRDFLVEMAPKDLDIDDQVLMPEPYAVATTTTVPVLIFNTNLVNESDLQGTWEDFTDPKWSGKSVIWNRSGVLLSNLVPKWGEEKTKSYVEELSANEPVLNESTFDIAQQVGAGTNPIGLGLYHTTYDVQQTGAPIGIKVLDPVPASQLYSGVVKDGPNTMSAQCFLGWLSGEEGSLAYEAATFRGNHLIAGTETAKLIEGYTTSNVPFSEIAKTAELTTEYNELLAQ